MSENDGDPLIIKSIGRASLIGSLFVTVVIGAVGLFVASAAVYLMLGGNTRFGLLLAALAAFTGILFRYVLRDTRAKQGWRIVAGSDGLELDLPGGRSLIHCLGRMKAKILFEEIEAIETRLEAYSSIGMVTMQRIFALRLKRGDLIILGEDRALNTGLASNTMSGAIEAIAQRGQLELRDLGMAQGRGGFLGVLFTAPPPWDAPDLPADRQEALWRAAGMTGSLAQAAAIGTRLR